jgi:hypothetical protein
VFGTLSQSHRCEALCKCIFRVHHIRHSTLQRSNWSDTRFLAWNSCKSTKEHARFAQIAAMTRCLWVFGALNTRPDATIRKLPLGDNEPPDTTSSSYSNSSSDCHTEPESPEAAPTATAILCGNKTANRPFVLQHRTSGWSVS